MTVMTTAGGPAPAPAMPGLTGPGTAPPAPTGEVADVFAQVLSAAAASNATPTVPSSPSAILPPAGVIPPQTAAIPASTDGVAMQQPAPCAEANPIPSLKTAVDDVDSAKDGQARESSGDEVNEAPAGAPAVALLMLTGPLPTPSITPTGASPDAASAPQGRTAEPATVLPAAGTSTSIPATVATVVTQEATAVVTQEATAAVTQSVTRGSAPTKDSPEIPIVSVSFTVGDQAKTDDQTLPAATQPTTTPTTVLQSRPLVPPIVSSEAGNVEAKAPADNASDAPSADSTPTPVALTPTVPSVHASATHATSSHIAAAPSTAGLGTPSAHIGASEVAHQIGRHIAASRLSSLTREHPMHLSVLLHPEDLGEVSVQLTLVSGRIDVQVSSQSDTTRDMLRQGMQDLRRQLSDSGVSVGDMDVRDGWSQQSNSSQNSANNADQRGSQQPRFADRTTTPSSRMTTPEPNVVHRPSRTGLDILA